MNELKTIVAACILFLAQSSLIAQTKGLQRIFDETLAQTSYILSNDKGEAMVIDPKRDVDTYLNLAKEKGLTIKYVAETHIHADFLSGSRELAKATNAELLLSGE